MSLIFKVYRGVSLFLICTLIMTIGNRIVVLGEQLNTPQTLICWAVVIFLSFNFGGQLNLLKSINKKFEILGFLSILISSGVLGYLFSF